MLPWMHPTSSTETAAGLRRLVLVLYALVGPVFGVAFFLLVGNEHPFATLAIASLIVVGTLVLLVRREPGLITYSFTGGIIPTLCCVIAYASLGPRGAAFLCALGAPVAWAALLFTNSVVVITWATAVAGAFTVIALQQGIGTALLNTAVIATVLGLVSQVVRGVSAQLHATRADQRDRFESAQALIRAIPDTVAVIDLEGRFLDVQSPAGDETPLPRELLLGRKVSDFVAEPVARQMVHALATISETSGVQTIEYEAAYGNRKRRFETRFSLAGRDRIVVIRRDVTERYATEQALKQSEERLAMALKGSTAATFDWNIRTDIVIRSASYAELLGYVPGELDSLPAAWNDLIHPEDHARVLANRNAHLQGQTDEYNVDYRMRTREGNWRWVRSRARTTERDEAGSPLRLTGTVSLVDDEHDEQERQLQNARLEGLANRVNEIELVMREDGRLTTMNDRAQEAYGYTRAEMLELNIRDLRAPSTRGNIDALMQRTVADRGIQFESEHVRKDGTIFPVAISSRVFEVAGERYLHSLVRDLTKEKLAEAKLRESLRERETLLKEVHHRVKNNLQVMVSLFALEAERISDPLARAALLDSQERLHSMAMIHEQLYQSADLARVDLAAYVNSLVSALRAVHRPAAGVEIRVVTAPVQLGIDRAVPCALVIHELVSNALKYAFPEGRSGRIEVALGQGAQPHTLSLCVRDDGIGLPPELDVAKTTTLGLQLVHILARQLHATLSLDRRGGTAFELAFAEGSQTP